MLPILVLMWRTFLFLSTVCVCVCVPSALGDYRGRHDDADCCSVSFFGLYLSILCEWEEGKRPETTMVLTNDEETFCKRKKGRRKKMATFDVPFRAHVKVNKWKWTDGWVSVSFHLIISLLFYLCVCVCVHLSLMVRDKICRLKKGCDRRLVWLLGCHS